MVIELGLRSGTSRSAGSLSEPLCAPVCLILIQFWLHDQLRRCQAGARFELDVQPHSKLSVLKPRELPACHTPPFCLSVFRESDPIFTFFLLAFSSLHSFVMIFKSFLHLLVVGRAVATVQYVGINIAGFEFGCGIDVGSCVRIGTRSETDRIRDRVRRLRHNLL